MRGWTKIWGKRVAASVGAVSLIFLLYVSVSPPLPEKLHIILNSARSIELCSLGSPGIGSKGKDGFLGGRKLLHTTILDDQDKVRVIDILCSQLRWRRWYPFGFGCHTPHHALRINKDDLEVAICYRCRNVAFYIASEEVYFCNIGGTRAELDSLFTKYAVPLPPDENY